MKLSAINLAITSWCHCMHQNNNLYVFAIFKSAQGLNPKVTVKYSIKLRLEFSNTKGRTKAGRYVNVPLSTSRSSTPIWRLAHQSFRGILVRFVSLDSKSKLCKCHFVMSRTCRKNVWTVLCQTVKLIMWFPINCGNDKQHNSKSGAIKLWEPCKAQHLQLCHFLNSAGRLAIIELIQQYQKWI